MATGAASSEAIDRLPAAAIDVLEFWFGPRDGDIWGTERREWFRKNAAFDAQVRDRFAPLIEQALLGDCAAWTGPWGALAEIVLLDQFTRNAFRGTPRSFAGDARALARARSMVAAHDDTALPPTHRTFVYLPFEHAEDPAMQDESVRLFRAMAATHPPSAAALDFAERHRAVIARFGRFPHRNALLGRTSTAEEAAFLGTHGSRF